MQMMLQLNTEAKSWSDLFCLLKKIKKNKKKAIIAEIAINENKEIPAPAISNIGYIQPVCNPPLKKQEIIIIPKNKTNEQIFLKTNCLAVTMYPSLSAIHIFNNLFPTVCIFLKINCGNKITNTKLTT